MPRHVRTTKGQEQKVCVGKSKLTKGKEFAIEKFNTISFAGSDEFNAFTGSMNIAIFSLLRLFLFCGAEEKVVISSWEMFVCTHCVNLSLQDFYIT